MMNSNDKQNSKIENNTIEISASALKNNLSAFKKILSSKTTIIPIIKSNAYGHGLKEILSILVNEKKKDKIKFVGVNSLNEAIEINKLSPEVQILIMGQIEPYRYSQTNNKPYTVLCSSIDEVLAYSSLPQAPKLHIKIDTGMGRLGLATNEVEAFLKIIKAKNIAIDGLATHFANVEDVTDFAYPLLQLKQFKEIQILFKKAGYTKLKIHAAASAAALLLEDARLDYIRLGISLYGAWPSAETKLSANHCLKKLPKLESVLCWKSQIVHIQKLEKNSPLGYGCSYRTNRDSRIAILPFGYYEGYPRQLSNKAYVLVNGQRAAIVGRVCMNMTLADITDIPSAKKGSEVIVLGKDANTGEEISADTLAGLSNTINYEIFTNIKAHLKRVLIK